MKQALSFVILLITAPILAAQTPPAPPTPAAVSIPSALTVNVNGSVDLTATTNCDQVKWVYPKQGIFFVDYGKHGGDPKQATILGLTPGTYTIGIYGSKWDGKTASTVTEVSACVITVASPTPPPPPPVATPIFVLAIGNSSTASTTNQQAISAANSAYWTGLTARSIKYAILDISNATDAATAANFTQWTAKTGIPALIVMDATGAVLDSIQLPASTAGIDTEIAKFVNTK